MDRAGLEDLRVDVVVSVQLQKKGEREKKKRNTSIRCFDLHATIILLKHNSKTKTLSL